ncbi:MAG: helix-turn-helix domain-containing protein [Ruminococcaceae bacterium]|nr:helix-turn-helix domain-containing protein [Oscillospiraceae bacterium]
MLCDNIPKRAIHVGFATGILGTKEINMNYCDTKEIPKTRDERSLVPITHGEQKCSPGHYWGAGVRMNYLIHYVISGSGVFYCGPNKFTVSAGQIFVVYPGTVIKYSADDNDPWHYTWISFSGDVAKDILAQAGISLRSPVLTLKNGEAALDILRRMPGERGANLATNLLFSAALYEFMALIADNSSESREHENAYLITAKNYIKAHYYEDISVESVAAHIGISRKYLYAIFKNGAGISPKEYITSCRINRAIELLRNKELTIGSIAYSVGYSDQLTFSKAFKLKTGRSPSEYR